MNLSIVPPYSIAMFAISLRYVLMKNERRSGSIRSLSSVKPSMSEKNIVRFFRLSGAARSCEPEKIEL